MTAACSAPAESAFLGEYLKGHGLATVAGCLFGLLFSARFFGGMSSYTRPRECFPINLAFRVILLVAVTIPLDQIKNVGTDSFWAMRFIGDVIPNFLVYFYAFGLCDKLCAKLKVIGEKNDDSNYVKV